MNCIHCGEPIPERRLKVLPNTNTCVSCSKVQPKLCLTVFTHKSTSEVVVVDTNDQETCRQAWNCYARSKGKDYNPTKKNPLRKCFQ